MKGILRRISTKRNERRHCREIETRLFRHETIFNFHMNNFGTLIENKADFFIIKNKVITFKNVESNWDWKINNFSSFLILVVVIFN